jgi:peptidoglycan/LPS O-acetylase OafA/YrhL
MSIWNLPRMYLHRYRRITPVLAVCNLVSVLLADHLGDGPYHKTWIRSNSRNCEEYWWAALLHVQNYVNPSRLCFHHSWYLSVDMQLFWAPPLIIYPAYKLGRKFIWTIPLMIVLTMGCAFMISYQYGFMAFPRLTGPAFIHYNRVIYLSTTHRMGSWLIGFLLAYILFKVHDKNFKTNRVIKIVMSIKEKNQ